MKNLDFIKEDSHNKSFYKRFNKYVIKSDKDDDCWKWKGAKSSHGYPVLNMGLKLKIFRVSRLLLQDINPILNNNKNVLHKCDNPECTNPKHLSWGTQKENMLDSVNKGRNYKLPVLTRDKTSRCVIKSTDIPDIKKLAETKNAKEISVIYGVNQETARRLLKKENIKCPDKRLSKNKKL